MWPQGIVLIDPGQLLFYGTITADGLGAGSAPIGIPSGPTLIGLRVTFQCLFDLAPSLTNGVELVVCP